MIPGHSYCNLSGRPIPTECKLVTQGEQNVMKIIRFLSPHWNHLQLTLYTAIITLFLPTFLKSVFFKLIKILFDISNRKNVFVFKIKKEIWIERSAMMKVEIF